MRPGRIGGGLTTFGRAALRFIPRRMVATLSRRRPRGAKKETR